MKIAIIAGTFFPLSGGVQVEIHNMANKLVQKGHSVDVYVYKNVDLKNNLYTLPNFESPSHIRSWRVASSKSSAC